MTAGEKLRWLELCKDEPIVLHVDGDNLIVNAGGGKVKVVSISEVLNEKPNEERIDNGLSRLMRAIDKVEEGTHFAEFRKKLSEEAKKKVDIEWDVIDKEIEDLERAWQKILVLT